MSTARKTSQQQDNCCRVIYLTKSPSMGLIAFLFMHMQLQKNYHTCPLWIPSSSSTLHSLSISKNACKNSFPYPFKFPLCLCMLTFTFPNVDFTQSPCSHKYGMRLFTPTLVHVFNDRIWEHSDRKIEGLYPIIILERWVGINTHEKFPLLDPLHRPSPLLGLSITPHPYPYNIEWLHQG
jgi:hypothetical protein